MNTFATQYILIPDTNPVNQAVSWRLYSLYTEGVKQLLSKALHWRRPLNFPVDLVM